MLTTKIGTPLAVEHFRVLLKTIPENMMQQTVSLNAHNNTLYLRPSILASFLDRFALPKMYKGIPGLRIRATSNEVTFTVRGAHALVALQNLNLPTHTQSLGRYEFVDKENLILAARVTHPECKKVLQSIYGENLSYGPSIIAKLGEHLGAHRASLVDPTRIRVKKAYEKGQGRN